MIINEKYLKEYESLISNAEDKRLLDHEKALFAEYAKSLEPILVASREFRTDAAMEEIAKTGDLPARLAKAFEEHMKFNDELGKTEAKEALREVGVANTVAIVVLRFLTWTRP